MPAPDNLYAVYKEEDGTSTRVKVICLALDSIGNIEMLTADDDGIIDSIEASNLMGVVYE